MKKEFCLIALLSAIIFLFGCSNNKTEDLPNYPKPINFVNDFEHVLRSSLVDSMNVLLDKIANENELYVAVVTLPFDSNIDEDSFFNYTLNLARSWKVGTAEGRGVLIAFSTSQRQWRVQLTDDLANLTTPNEIKELFNDRIRKYFKDSNYSDGIFEFTNNNLELLLAKTDTH